MKESSGSSLHHLWSSSSQVPQDPQGILRSLREDQGALRRFRQYRTQAVLSRHRSQRLPDTVPSRWLSSLQFPSPVLFLCRSIKSCQLQDSQISHTYELTFWCHFNMAMAIMIMYPQMLRASGISPNAIRPHAEVNRIFV